MKWIDLAALVAIAGVVGAFMIWRATSYRYAGTYGLVGGLLVASAARRFDAGK